MKNTIASLLVLLCCVLSSIAIASFAEADALKGVQAIARACHRPGARRELNILASVTKDQSDQIGQALEVLGLSIQIFHVNTVGELAATFAEPRKWDVVILDFARAEVPGLEALRAVRTNDVAIPLIVVGGLPDSEEELVPYFAGGITDYIPQEQWATNLPPAVIFGWQSGSRTAPEQDARIAEVQLKIANLAEQIRMARADARRQRNQVVGTMVDAIAHEFRNLLTPILGYMELVRPSHPDRLPLTGASLTDAYDQITDAAKKLKSLVELLLANVRGHGGKHEPMNLVKVVQDAVSLFRSVMKRVQFETDYGKPSENIWPIMGDSGQLNTVLVNLIVNANDAMAEQGGGKVTVKVENKRLTAVEAMQYPEAREAAYVVVTVSDTGKGVSAENLPKLFTFGYTDKEKGTGQGLANSQGIVRGHGGFMTVYSELGKGTVFKVFLPADETRIVPTGLSKVLEPIRGEGLILVVDDEAAVRMVAEKMLQMHGYTVVAARDGEEAVRIYQQRRSDIRGVVMDVTMPKLDGPTTARAILAIDPNAKILITSGYSESVGSFPLLTKPFSAFTLTHAIHDLLNPPAP